MRSSLRLLCFGLLPFATACGMFTGVDSDNLVASGSDDAGSDDGSNGRRDAGSSAHRDSGASGGGGGSSFDGGGGSGGGGGGGGGGSLGAQCTALQSCCATLDSSVASDCDDAVAGAVESTCTSTLASYRADGYCGGTVTPPPPVDAGVGTLSDPCTTLLTCCLGAGATTSADPNCVNTGIGGDPSACLTEYNADVALGICN